MAPILEGTADVGPWQQPNGPLALYLSIPYEFRVAILSAILLALAIVKVSLRLGGAA
jgi:hypothetical protein